MESNSASAPGLKDKSTLDSGSGSGLESVSVSCQNCIISILSLLGFDDFNLNQHVDSSSSVSLSSSHPTHPQPQPLTSISVSLNVTRQQTQALKHESHPLQRDKSSDGNSERVQQSLRNNNLAQFGITPAQIALASQILNSNKKKRSALFTEVIISKEGLPNVNYSVNLNSTATRDESSYSLVNANESYETVTEPSVIMSNNQRDRSKRLINSHFDFSSALIQLTTNSVSSKIFSKGTEGTHEIPPTAFFLFPSKAVPNVNYKVFEAAIWFLFNLLDPNAAREVNDT
jgi:hypothetical protein